MALLHYVINIIMMDSFGLKKPCLRLDCKVVQLCECYYNLVENILNVFQNCLICRENGLSFFLRLKLNSQIVFETNFMHIFRQYLEEENKNCDERNKLCCLNPKKHFLNNVTGIVRFFKQMHNPNTYIFCKPYFFQPDYQNFSLIQSFKVGLTLGEPKQFYIASKRKNVTQICFSPSLFFSWGLQIMITRKITFRQKVTLETLSLEKVLKSFCQFAEIHKNEIIFKCSYSSSTLYVCTSFLEALFLTCHFLPNNLRKKLLCFLQSVLICVYYNEIVSCNPISSYKRFLEFSKCTKCSFCKFVAASK